MLWSVFLVLCAKSTLAEKRVYEIIGKKSGPIGLYVETGETQVFQNIGKTAVGRNMYLFRRSDVLNEWRIGFGETIKDLEKESYKASGGKDEPPADGWTTMEGYSDRINFTVTKKPTLVSSLKETVANSGSATLDGGALCLDKTSDRNTAKWIMLEGDDPKICDSNEDYKEGWDEVCLEKAFKGPEALKISGGETKTRGVYELKRNNASVPLFYSKMDKSGYIR